MLGTVLATIVMVLVCKPILFSLLNTTAIVASAPGAMGSSGKVGTVQPQLAEAEEKLKEVESTLAKKEAALKEV